MSIRKEGLRIVIALCFGSMAYSFQVCSSSAQVQTIAASQVISEKTERGLQQPLSNGHYYRPSAAVLMSLEVIDVYVFDDFKNRKRFIVLFMHQSDQNGKLRRDLNLVILKLEVLPKRKEWAPNLIWNESIVGDRALISTELLIKHFPAGIRQLGRYLKAVKPFPIPKVDK